MAGWQPAPRIPVGNCDVRCKPPAVDRLGRARAIAAARRRHRGDRGQCVRRPRLALPGRSRAADRVGGAVHSVAGNAERRPRPLPLRAAPRRRRLLLSGGRKPARDALPRPARPAHRGRTARNRRTEGLRRRRRPQSAGPQEVRDHAQAGSGRTAGDRTAADRQPVQHELRRRRAAGGRRARDPATGHPRRLRTHDLRQGVLRPAVRRQEWKADEPASLGRPGSAN